MATKEPGGSGSKTETIDRKDEAEKKAALDAKSAADKKAEDDEKAKDALKFTGGGGAAPVGRMGAGKKDEKKEEETPTPDKTIKPGKKETEEKKEAYDIGSFPKDLGEWIERLVSFSIRIGEGLTSYLVVEPFKFLKDLIKEKILPEEDEETKKTSDSKERPSLTKETPDKDESEKNDLADQVNDLDKKTQLQSQNATKLKPDNGEPMLVAHKNVTSETPGLHEGANPPNITIEPKSIAHKPNKTPKPKTQG